MNRTSKILAQAVTIGLVALLSNSIFSADLSSVPGFGSTEAAGLRDDTIALWEAFQRENETQSCMASSGFTYHIEVAFPAMVAFNVSEQFDLPDARSIDTNMSLRGFNTTNIDYTTSLDEQSLDAYYQTLYGESAADMESFSVSGIPPDGRNDFARSGCFGQSLSKLPGLYKIVQPIKAAINSETLKEFKKQDEKNKLKDCAAENITTKIVKCEEKLESDIRRYRDEETKKIESKYSAILEKQKKKYEKAISKISSDREFMKFLSVATHDVSINEAILEIEDKDHMK